VASAGATGGRPGGRPELAVHARRDPGGPDPHDGARRRPGRLRALHAAAALDAAGYDPVVIETVGAGQSEVEVARLAETTVVVEVPEMGDEVQAIKAGLLEIADIIAVNKGDRPGADRAARQLRAMLSTAGGRVERKPPPVMVTTATTEEGVAALADAIEAHRSHARSPLAARERAANQVRRALADLAARRAGDAEAWDATVQSVADRELDPMTAAERLLDR
jgi:LAO/AO transport system kinase